MSVVAGADAYGQNTAAIVDANMRMFDRGLASFAVGSVVSIAAANGDGAYAATYAQVDVSGADLGKVSTSQVASADGSFMSTTTSFAVVDLKFDLKLAGCGGVTVSEQSGLASPQTDLSGNVASFEVDALVEAQNSYADVVADALAIEDAMSSTTIAATTALTASVTYTIVRGTIRDDQFSGTSSHDLMMGGKGNDTMRGLQGNDWMFGEQGNDRLEGGDGDDTMFGGTGKDVLLGGDGADWLFGGDDNDELDGGQGQDLLSGGSGSDTLRGGAGDDFLDGGKGKDRLFGDGGNDLFRLGASGGDDDDIYTGGAGVDTYLIRDKIDDDTITDFNLAQGDRIVLDEDVDHWSVSIRISSSDRNDLEITFSGQGAGSSSLVLDDFFRINPEFKLAGSKPTSKQQADHLVDHIFGQTVDDANGLHVFVFADILFDLG
ncbi:calcium-binding protein [Endobacterium cereale]|uniref:calcium-binding protein n=1 Tax=Endobacterium cereale TaxID=2663029 RepID=UPI001AD95005|nr:calcium-binding protein [Endobacterium cereale]MEB2847244.1 calcium-binding protein [Endobacterium cereale]